MEAVVAVAVAVAHEVGLTVQAPSVLSAGPTTVVHLVPERVVARVVPDGGPTVREPLVRELAVTEHLRAAGAAVAAPARSVHPGPYERDGMLVTLWEHVDHDPARPLDAVRAGRALRGIHDLLRDVDATTLPHFVRAEESRALADRLHLRPDERRLLDAVLDAARAVGEGIDAGLQAVHGDAHLGNVLRTGAGPVWGDVNRLCRGPRELDLACNEIRVLSAGRTPADDDLLRGYGEHDPDLVSLLVPVHLATLAPRTFEFAGRRPEFAPLAERRLRWAAERLGL